MNSEQFEGKWKQFQGQIRQKWGHLTDNDMQVIAGKRDVLIGRVEERYGLAKEKATAEVDAFLKTLQDQPEAQRAGFERAGTQRTYEIPHCRFTLNQIATVKPKCCASSQLRVAPHRIVYGPVGAPNAFAVAVIRGLVIV